MKKNRLTTSVTFVGILLLSNITYAAPYTQKDLDALAANGAHQELVEHAKDISPSARDAKWRGMVEKSALALIKASPPSPGYRRQVPEYYLTMFPFLKDSKDFMAKRDEAGLSDVKYCAQQRYGGPCVDVANEVMKDSKNHELAMELGRTIRVGMNGQASIPYFHRALENAPKSMRKKYCTDEQIPVALAHTFGGPKNPSTDRALEIVHTHCTGLLDEIVMDIFLDGGSYQAEALCPLLKKQKKLTPFQRAHCADTEGK